MAKGDTVKELGNNIMVVYQDKKNNYWFGSWQDGLYKYDGHTILHFTTKDGLPDNRIDEIKEDRSGNIYVNTSKGISQFNGHRFTTLLELEVYGGNSGWELHADDVWFKSSEYRGDVYRCNGRNFYRLRLPKNKLGEDYMLKHPNSSNPYAVYCVYKDSKGAMWFGTAALGVCRFNGTSVHWISERDVTELHNGPANGVRAIAEDEHGYFWFNTEYCYNVYDSITPLKSNSGNDIFYRRIKSIGSLDGKKDGTLNEYLSIVKDNDNNLWIATYRNGVWKYDGEHITHYPVVVNSNNITVFYLYKDNNGDLWLGTHEHGVCKFNGHTFEQFKP